MRALALRGLVARRLRSVLTGLAVVLGVAMIAGTYVETDQIDRAFNDIERSVNRGIDVVLKPRTAFESQLTQPRPLDSGLIDRVRRVPGVARAAGQIQATGSLVVRGHYVRTNGPALVYSALPRPFDPTEVLRGRQPTASGEIAVNRAFASDQGLRVGQRVGLAANSGLQPVTIVGVVDYAGVSSLGGATIVFTTFADAQRWFDREGRTSTVVASASPGVGAPELARRIRAAVPGSVKVQTGRERADQESRQISQSVGAFLDPVLFALAGAALLVGAFIIFNTFSITVAQRAREFALLRTLGATRGQVLRAVSSEAVLIGGVAAILGLALGIGLAQLLNRLFDAAGFGIPTSDIVVQTRTVVIALGVGVGVTLLASLVPALRATRVPPAAVLHEGAAVPGTRLRRFAPYAAAVVALGGVALLLAGLLGTGPAVARAGAAAGGAVLVFVGVALVARYLVRPLAEAIGWPLARAFHETGRLARENAMRNPGRTAVTSASLMVGLGLVVFVAVLANTLKTSFSDSLTRLVKADLIVATNLGGQAPQPLPRRSVEALRSTSGVAVVAPLTFDQVKVNGRPVNLLTDVVSGIDPATLKRVYALEWVGGGSDALLRRLRGDRILVEEQFAKVHQLRIGSTFTVTTPSRGHARLTVLGEYKDPQILQGSLVAQSTFNALSPVRDPFVAFVRRQPGASGAAVKRNVQRALRAFPAAQVRSNAEYRDQLAKSLDQLVYLLYALLAMSVVISLFGIANSLALSIHERRRELGTLRAIGATQSQIRRMVRYESVITAVIGGLLGTAIGLLFAWVMARALADLGLGFSVPAGQLVAFMVLAVVVGVVAAVLPARRAARTKVLEALRYE